MITYNFYGIGFDKTSKEIYEISNDVNFNVQGYIFNCPKSWLHKIPYEILEQKKENL